MLDGADGAAVAGEQDVTTGEAVPCEQEGVDAVIEPGRNSSPGRQGEARAGKKSK